MYCITSTAPSPPTPNESGVRGAGANLMSFHDTGTVLSVIYLGVIVVNYRFSGYLNIVNRTVLSFLDLRIADSSYIVGYMFPV